jgi:hypothetical protein
MTRRPSSSSDACVDARLAGGFHHGMMRRVGLASGAALAVFLAATGWLGRLERGGPAQGDLLLAGGVPATRPSSSRRRAASDRPRSC